MVLYRLETDLPKSISSQIKRDLFQLTILRLVLYRLLEIVVYSIQYTDYLLDSMCITPKSKELIESLPDALSKFLVYVLLQKPDVKLKEGINFFAQISNPHSLSKVSC